MRRRLFLLVAVLSSRLILYELTDVTYGLGFTVRPQPGWLDHSQPLHLVHQVDQPHGLVLLLLLTHSLRKQRLETQFTARA